MVGLSLSEGSIKRFSHASLSVQVGLVSEPYFAQDTLDALDGDVLLALLPFSQLNKYLESLDKDISRSVYR